MDTLNPDTIKDFLPIVFERSNAAQSLWNFYVVVVFGIAGFLASAPTRVATNQVKAFLSLGFVVFILLNLPALFTVTRERQILIGAVNAAISKSPLSPLQPVIEQSVLPLWGLIAVHSIIDLAVLAAIWAFRPISTNGGH
jgi:hypothetical protein